MAAPKVLAAAALFEMAGTEEQNRELVQQAWALASHPARGAIPGLDHGPEQQEAQRKGRGLWRGDLTEPWVWRRGKQGASQSWSRAARQASPNT